MREMAQEYLKHSLFILVTIILVPLGATYVYANKNSKNVLILNSYHKGLVWTDQEVEGITDVLKSYGPDCSISVEYMDWKNYPQKENLDHIFNSLKYKYSHKRMDLIIATDDAALEFALKNRAEIFSNAFVVFCGVNEEGVNRITQGYSNFTGVVEKIDPEKTLQAALEIKPNLKKIYVVFDGTESGVSTGDLTIQTIRKLHPELEIRTLTDKRFRDILKEVRKAPEDSIIFITTYYKDAEGVVIGFENFCRIVSQNSKVPVFSLYDLGMGYGPIGGSMLSGRLQGESAGKIALGILWRENISEIPLQGSKTTRYIFDYMQMKRFNIPLNRVPKGSEVINKPFSFFEAYKTLVITVGIIFLLLVVFILVLIFYLSKISIMRKALYRSNKELARLYEELTASDEELKQRFDELTQVQRSLVASEERYELLFEKMLNGFVVFEPLIDEENRIKDVRFINVNPSFENQTTLKASDIRGKTWTEIFNSHNKNLELYQRILQTGESEYFETCYQDGSVYYLVNAFRIKENYVGVVINNITEYKEAIKRVRKLNAELEQRVVERTTELQDAVNELEAFTYTVSHELKSPLRAVDGYSKIILEDFGEKLGEEGTEMILNICDVCKDMMEMINKLLQYSTTSRSVLLKEEINIEEMFRLIFGELKAACPEWNPELKIETRLPMVKADRILIKQVISNILSNAIKFTRNRVKPLITVGSSITENEYLFYVKDNGVGFDMEFSEKLFGLFQRLHTSDEFEGSGIGLVTAKKIIEKHSGRIRIEGRVDEGATVYFTLPFTRDSKLTC